MRPLLNSLIFHQQAIDQPPASNGGQAKDAEGLSKSCSSAATCVIASGHTAKGLYVLTYTGNAYEKRISAGCHLQGWSFSQSQEIQSQGKGSDNQLSPPNDLDVRKTIAEQSESCSDQHPRNLIGDTSTAESAEKNPIADEKQRTGMDTSVRKPASGNSPLRDQPLT